MFPLSPDCDLQQRGDRMFTVMLSIMRWMNMILCGHATPATDQRELKADIPACHYVISVLFLDPYSAVPLNDALVIAEG